MFMRWKAISDLLSAPSPPSKAFFEAVL